MKLKIRHTLVAVVVLLVVGCSASAAPRIDELEARLGALQWTEQDAIAIVKSKLRERLVACGGEAGCVLPGGPRTVIRLSGTRSDPVLTALPALPAYGRLLVGGWTLKYGEWSAVHEPLTLRWQVESLIWVEDSAVKVYFYAYEKTGLVEGIPFSKLIGMTLEERIRKIREDETPPTTK